MTTYIHWKNVAFKSFFFHKLISTLFYNNIHSEDGNLSLDIMRLLLIFFFFISFPKKFFLLSWNYCLKKLPNFHHQSSPPSIQLPFMMPYHYHQKWKKVLNKKCVHNDYKLREINTYYLPNNYILFIVDFRTKGKNDFSIIC